MDFEVLYKDCIIINIMAIQHIENLNVLLEFLLIEWVNDRSY